MINALKSKLKNEAKVLLNKKLFDNIYTNNIKK
jgi:hypothetical protein